MRQIEPASPVARDPYRSIERGWRRRTIPHVTLQEALPFLIPLVILQVVLMAAGLYDLTRPDRRVKGDNKWAWGLIIVLGQMIGPLVYFFFGREDV